MTTLNGTRILIFVGSDYEDMELQYPKYRLREAGAEVVLAGQEAGALHHGKYGYPERAEVGVAELDTGPFHGLVVPGGWMPDKLRRDPEVLRITREFHEAGKCVASICHGPWITISAGVVRGLRYTSSPGIRDDLENAGATWVNQSVVVDRHHVSSRRPDDLPAFMEAVLGLLASR